MLPAMNRILLVEDHAAMRELVMRELHQSGIAVDAVGRVSEAEACLAQARYAALVLDRGLPAGVLWGSAGALVAAVVASALVGRQTARSTADQAAASA